MYIFTQPVFQIGGNTSEGTLMIPSEGSKTKIQIRQYFERTGWEDVEFHDLARFCTFLEEKFFRDDRKVFFSEQPHTKNFLCYSTSPHIGYEHEVFLCGTFEYIGGT